MKVKFYFNIILNYVKISIDFRYIWLDMSTNHYMLYLDS